MIPNTTVNTLVPLPDDVTHKQKAISKTRINVRFGPDVAYDKVTKTTPPQTEIQLNDTVTYYLPAKNDGKGRDWVFVTIDVGVNAGREGWLSLTDFTRMNAGEPQEIFKPAPPPPAPVPPEEPPTSTVSLDSTVVDTAPAVIIPPTDDDKPDQTVTQFIVNVTRVKSTGALAITVTSENSAAVERILATAIALTQIARPLIKQLVKYEAIIDSLTFSISDSKTNKS